MIIDSGWQFPGEFHGDDPIEIDGVNILDHRAAATEDTVLMTPTDSPGILVAFGVSEIRIGERIIRFGLAELQPTHYAVVVPS